eukprot:3666515-Pleurochrysis_carterae.AAC.1
MPTSHPPTCLAAYLILSATCLPPTSFLVVPSHLVSHSLYPSVHLVSDLSIAHILTRRAGQPRTYILRSSAALRAQALSLDAIAAPQRSLFRRLAAAATAFFKPDPSHSR